jgi:hypothetical protein
MSIRPKRSSVRRTIWSGTPSAATSPGTAESAGANFIRQRLGAVAVADVHRNGGAALVQACYDSPAQTAPRTRNDGDTPCKISVFHPKNFSPCLNSAHVPNAAIKAGE